MKVKKPRQPIQSRNYNYDIMTLVVADTGKPVCKGDIVDKCTVLGGTAPHKPSSTGRILIESHGMMTEYFPSVLGLKWVGDSFAPLSPETRAAIIEWALDCEWREEVNAEYLEAMSDAQLIRAINRHYAGGFKQFLGDSCAS